MYICFCEGRARPKQRLAILSHTYQWLTLAPFHGNTIKRLSMKPKGCLRDTGLACSLQRIPSAEALAVNPALGSLFETWAVNEVYRLSQALDVPPGHDTRGLAAFRHSYPQRKIMSGLIIYAGRECYRLAQDVIALPWNNVVV